MRRFAPVPLILFVVLVIASCSREPVPLAPPVEAGTPEVGLEALFALDKGMPPCIVFHDNFVRTWTLQIAGGAITGTMVTEYYEVYDVTGSGKTLTAIARTPDACNLRYKVGLVLKPERYAEGTYVTDCGTTGFWQGWGEPCP